MDKAKFIVLMQSILSDTVEDTKYPDRIPKYRANREIKTVKALAAGCGVDLTDKEANEIVGW